MYECIYVSLLLPFSPEKALVMICAHSFWLYCPQTPLSPPYHVLELPCGSDGKESACNAGDLGSILGFGRSPGGGHGNPLQYSHVENIHGQRSLEGL